MAPAPESRYFHNAIVTIVRQQGDAFIRLNWTAVSPQPEELRAAYEHALRALQHFGLHKLLSDHTQRQPMPAAVSIWVAEDWIPRAVREVGYSHCAVVENATPLGRLAAQSIGAQLPQGLLVFKYFSTPAEAAAWLNAQ
jgi:hypothetical protein